MSFQLVKAAGRWISWSEINELRLYDPISKVSVAVCSLPAYDKMPTKEKNGCQIYGKVGNGGSSNSAAIAESLPDKKSSGEGLAVAAGIVGVLAAL
jgi:hypothetical protein